MASGIAGSLKLMMRTNILKMPSIADPPTAHLTENLGERIESDVARKGREAVAFGFHVVELYHSPSANAALRA
jgi:hypothetical protein